jgi:hypothetical protein
VIAFDSIHDHNVSRLINRPGAYEWWEICAFNSAGTGIVVKFFRADPFATAYRLALQIHMTGRAVDPAQIQPMSFPAISVAMFHERKLLARTHVAGLPGAFHTDDHSSAAWKIAFSSGASLSRDADGWTLRLDRFAATRRRDRISIRPGRNEFDCEIHGQIHLNPAFQAITLQRAAMPDGPDGSTHEWLCTCPSAITSGCIQITSIRPPSRRQTEPSVEFDLDGSTAGFDHFWGTGLIGHGMRRWYRAAMRWNQGAVLAELPVIRKYIQLAGTMMRFAPNALPELTRCDHQRTKVFQRSAWLLAHPMELQWAREEEHQSMTHEIKSLHDALPYRGFAFTDAKYTTGRPPDHTIVGPMIGTFEMIQPARADWWLWRKLVRRDAGRPIART